MVSGCGNPTVSKIIAGEYVSNGQNHGRPVFKKASDQSSAVTVLIYYWDDRDGKSFHGWWFGPKVGGDQVWAYNSDVNKTASLPPVDGWHVPWDGPLDTKLRLTYGGVSNVPSMVPPPGRPGTVPNRAAEDEERRRREELRRRDEERERERRREEAERAEKEKKRQQREREEREEEERRREAEARRRREEEQRRREDQAISSVERALSKLKSAGPENFEILKSDLEKALKSNMDAMGPKAARIAKEAESAIRETHRRIEDVKRQREEDERRKKDAERKAAAEAARIGGLLVEGELEVKEAEGHVVRAGDSTRLEAPVGTLGSDQTPQSLLEQVELASNEIRSAREFLDKTNASLKAKGESMGTSEAAKKRRSEIGAFFNRLADGRKSLDRYTEDLEGARNRARRRLVAMRLEQEQKASFTKYDTDGDLQLSRAEVAAYAQAEFSFEVPEQILDKIMRVLTPIGIDKLIPLRQKVAIAKAEVEERIRLAAEIERKQHLEEKRKDLKALLAESEQLIYDSKAVLTEADAIASKLPKDNELSADETNAAAADAEKKSAEAGDVLQRLKEKLSQIDKELDTSPELKNSFKSDVPWYAKEYTKYKDWQSQVLAACAAGKERAVQKAYAERELHQSNVVTAIRGSLTASSKTAAQLFDELNTDGSPMDAEGFAKLVESLKNVTLNEAEVQKLFEHIVGDAGSLNKDRFLEIIRLFYKCLKSTVLSEEVSIKSKTVRKLKEGEVLEAIEGPLVEEGVGVKRVRCRAVTDDATGWATIAGNQGTSFLIPGGNLFTCKEEITITDIMSLPARTIRTLAKEELLEVLEFPRKEASADVQRVRAKCKVDGVTGWVTMRTQNTVYMEPA